MICRVCVSALASSKQSPMKCNALNDSLIVSNAYMVGFRFNIMDFKSNQISNKYSFSGTCRIHSNEYGGFLFSLFFGRFLSHDNLHSSIHLFMFISIKTKNKIEKKQLIPLCLVDTLKNTIEIKMKIERKMWFYLCLSLFSCDQILWNLIMFDRIYK